MNVMIFNASPRPGGNSDWLSDELVKKYNTEELKYYQLRELNFGNCHGCTNCKTGDGFCEVEDDLKPVFQEILDSDLIVFISPNYYAQITGLGKTFLDRWACLRKRKGIPQFRPEQKMFFIMPQGSSNRSHGEPANEWAKRLFTMFGLKYYGMVIPGCASQSRDGIRLKLDDIKMSLNMFP
ncbi:flavodoxin family protein [Limisalsivibrio acetivorans]|uniref:flavodoxin family protein n=1 Tax=Limisalsivibrio acetivorans TaxID=1304888 RepID=UPI0003B71526|nr:flavodoxin family protein [Limisalsivibrio acetivorans]